MYLRFTRVFVDNEGADELRQDTQHLLVSIIQPTEHPSPHPLFTDTVGNVELPLKRTLCGYKRLIVRWQEHNDSWFWVTIHSRHEHHSPSLPLNPSKIPHAGPLIGFIDDGNIFNLFKMTIH